MPAKPAEIERWDPRGIFKHRPQHVGDALLISKEGFDLLYRGIRLGAKPFNGHVTVGRDGEGPILGSKVDDGVEGLKLNVHVVLGYPLAEQTFLVEPREECGTRFKSKLAFVKGPCTAAGVLQHLTNCDRFTSFHEIQCRTHTGVSCPNDECIDLNCHVHAPRVHPMILIDQSGQESSFNCATLSTRQREDFVRPVRWGPYLLPKMENNDTGSIIDTEMLWSSFVEITTLQGSRAPILGRKDST